MSINQKNQELREKNEKLNDGKLEYLNLKRDNLRLVKFRSDCKRFITLLAQSDISRVHHVHVCTCTLSWLVKYAQMYQVYDTETFEYTHYFYRLNSTLFCQDTLSKCNFSLKLEQCYKHNEPRQRESGFFEEAMLYFNLKLIQYITEVFLQPFFCSI